MRSTEEIQEEIATLKKIRPTVRRQSMFGDDHHDAIDGQLDVLENLWDEDEVCDRCDNAAEDEPHSAENVRDSMLEAVHWLHEETDERPSEGWKELVVG